MIDRKFRLPRIWSNQELRKVGALFSGDIVNVSGWKDEDKEGGHYRDYFPNLERYTITNYGGFRGFQGGEAEIKLDLEAPLHPELNGAFDVVFNHTTLEHIYDFKTAFANLCAMSRDVVIAIVPFSQTQHESEDFRDYWRFTPTGMRYLFEENGMKVVYESANNHIHAGIYVFVVGTKNPAKWQGKLPASTEMVDAAWKSAASVRELIKGFFTGKK